MKKFLILILICFVQNTYSQTIKSNKPSSASDENQVYNTAGIDVTPQFPGGINEFYRFIGQNYIVPKEKPDFAKGKVFTSFIIEKDGSISEVKILKDIGFGTGDEALRVLKLCPKWSPGKSKGKEVRVLYSLPINVN
jgi:protein TonB